MTFTVEQKSQLAKLMATENLRVEHQKIRTAKFDTKNRVLYLPVWQNMTGVLYDLLTGHEVGHALFTPTEGWHDAVLDKSKGRHYKHFLNVVEDARIEKKVKRRYPGLRLSFQKAYSELNDRDFFGLQGRDINTLPFIDRLNLFTKSQYSADWIMFNSEEKEFVSKVEKLESWEDVLTLTAEIYEYSKNEQFQIQNEHYEFDSNDQESDDEYSDDEYEFEESDEIGEPEQTGDETKKQPNDKSEESGANDGEDGEDVEEADNDENGKALNRHKESKESYSDQFEPECLTDESFRKKESLLLDERCKEYVYVDVPKANLQNIITPAKRVHELLSNFYNNGGQISNRYGTSYFFGGIKKEESTKWVSEFKQKNERYIGLLVKEFEMRKAAKSFSKSKLSDTGDIDVNKLSSYRFDDNIFRKVMLTPKGKSHGLVLLLDRSGSMAGNMSGSIEQILVLSMFCRKVNIPFVVYGFGDEVDAHLIDKGFLDPETGERTNRKVNRLPSFEVSENALSFSDVYLREYLNSSMSNSEFTQSVRNMIILQKSYENSSKGRIPRPKSEVLSNTPLTQAIYATGYIMREFRKKNNLDITSMIVIHDGDSDSNRYFYKNGTSRHPYTGVETQSLMQKGFSVTSQNVILRDSEQKYESKFVNDNFYDESLLAAFDWFRQTTKSKIFGFFITSDRVSSLKSQLGYRYVDNTGNPLANEKQSTDRRAKVDVLFKKMREEKFLISHNKGYDSFYLILGGDELKTENDELDIAGKVTTGKLVNAFMKMNKRKAINRVLVSKFIQGMAV